MQEQLISFETAELAKEKGFQEEELHYYLNGELLQHPNRLYYNFNQDNPPRNQFSAPTQSFLQKWLREKHRLIVLVGYNYEYDSTPYTYWIYKENESNPINQWVNDLHTYEDALELGLQETLKLIKNDNSRN